MRLAASTITAPADPLVYSELDFPDEGAISCQRTMLMQPFNHFGLVFGLLGNVLSTLSHRLVVMREFSSISVAGAGPVHGFFGPFHKVS